MEFTYENYGTNTYLVYEIKPGDEIDTMSLGMLTNNKIEGLVPVLYTQMDERKFLKYNVTAKVSVKQFFSGSVNKKHLTGVLGGMVNAMLSAEDYMLPVGSILLDTEYIFTDVSTCETALICLPVMIEEKLADLGGIFRNIVFHTQFDQTESCDYVANIINYLNGAGTFSLEGFRRVLDELEGRRPATVRQETAKPVAAPPQGQPSSVHRESVPQNGMPGRNTLIGSAPTGNAPSGSFSAGRTAAPAVNGNQMTAVERQAMESCENIQQEKRVSMMTLLTHYSKENKELYRRQKEERRQGKQGGGRKNAQAVPVSPFAIPGQPVPQPAAASETVQVPQPGQAPQVPQMSRAVPVPGAPQTPQSAQISQAVPVSGAARPSQEMPQQVKAGFGETVVLNVGMQIGETTVLGASDIQTEKHPYLIRSKNGEKIPVDKPVFRIGKEKSYVDYFIGDNTAISRSHANIIAREQSFYIVDTNSTNHTYVEGTMIRSNSEVQISHGTKFRLANEEFGFYLY